MILTAAITYTAAHIVLAVVGSAAGGAVFTAGGYAIYKLLSSKSDPEVEAELRTLNEETRHQLRQQVRTFATRNNQINNQIANTSSRILSNQEAIAHVESLLQGSTDEMQQNHKNIRVMIVDLDEANRLLNLVLQSHMETKEKNRNLTKANAELHQQFNTVISELQETVAEYKTVKEAILDASGQRDYLGKMIDLIKKMKSDNNLLKNKLETLTSDYAKKEMEISTKSRHITELLLLSEKQQSKLEQMKAEMSGTESNQPDNSEYNQRFFNF